MYDRWAHIPLRTLRSLECIGQPRSVGVVMAQPKDDNASSLPAAAGSLLSQIYDLTNAGRFSEVEDLRTELFDAVGRWGSDNLANDPDFQEEMVLEAHAVAGNW